MAATLVVVGVLAGAPGLDRAAGTADAAAATAARPESTASRPNRARPDRVVIVSIPRLGWDDVTPSTMPTLVRLADRGATASLSVKTIGRRTTPVEGYASIATGTRATAPENAPASGFGPEEVLPPSYRSVKLPAPSSGLPGGRTAADAMKAGGHRIGGARVVIPGIDAVTAFNQGRFQGADTGALGRALHAGRWVTAVIANHDGRSLVDRTAALAMADSAGRVDLGSVSPDLTATAAPGTSPLERTDPDAVVRSVGALPSKRVAAVVEIGDVAWADAAHAGPKRRQAAAGRVDRDLVRVLSQLDLDRDLVMVLSPAAPIAFERPTPFVMAGPGVEAGLAKSATTRRPGYITLPDIGPTVLARAGIDLPTSMGGTPITTAVRSTSGSVRVADAREAIDETRFIDRAAGKFIISYPIVFESLSFLTLVWLLLHVGAERLRSRQPGDPTAAVAGDSEPTPPSSSELSVSADGPPPTLPAGSGEVRATEPSSSGPVGGPDSTVLRQVDTLTAIAERLRPVLVWMGVMISAVPVLTFLLGGFTLRSWHLPTWFGVLWVLAMATGSIAVGAARRLLIPRSSLASRGPWMAVVVTAGFTWLVLVIDVLTGARLQFDTPLGNSPTVAGRFAGMGNIAFALLAASTLLLAWTVAAELTARGRRRLGVTLAAALFAIALVVDGTPGLGSDIGGVLVLAPVAIISCWLLAGRRLSWRPIVIAGLAAAAAIALFGLVDLSRPAPDRTHLGRLLAGDGHSRDVIIRKALAAGGSFLNSISLAFILFCIVVVAALFWKLRRRDVLATFPPGSTAWYLALTATALAVAGTALNDSGVIVAAMMAAVLAPAALAALLSPAGVDAGTAARIPVELGGSDDAIASDFPPSSDVVPATPRTGGIRRRDRVRFSTQFGRGPRHSTNWGDQATRSRLIFPPVRYLEGGS